MDPRRKLFLIVLFALAGLLDGGSGWAAQGLVIEQIPKGSIFVGGKEESVTQGAQESPQGGEDYQGVVLKDSSLTDYGRSHALIEQNDAQGASLGQKNESKEAKKGQVPKAQTDEAGVDSPVQDGLR